MWGGARGAGWLRVGGCSWGRVAACAGVLLGQEHSVLCLGWGRGGQGGREGTKVWLLCLCVQDNRGDERALA